MPAWLGLALAVLVVEVAGGEGDCMVGPARGCESGTSLKCIFQRRGRDGFEFKFISNLKLAVIT